MKKYFILIVCYLIAVLLFNTYVLADVYVANKGNASVTVYSTNSVGNASPIRTISGPLTNLNYPEGVTVDTVNNELYVADFFGQAVRVFSLNANGNVAPIRELIHGVNSNILQPRMVAVDTVNNEIYVISTNAAIRVFSRTASGDVSPTRIISGSNTLLNNPISISLDMVNNELIVDSYDVGGSNVPGILIFNRTDSGNIAPKRIISGNNTLMGVFTNYVRVDTVNNEIFSEGDNGAGVLVFSRTASGNVAPLRRIYGSSTGFIDVGGILPDISNNTLIISDENTNSLRVFSRTASGNVAPLFTISGPATGLSEPFGIDMDSSGGFNNNFSIPTLTQWGMISFVLFAGVGAVYFIRKKIKINI